MELTLDILFYLLEFLDHNQLLTWRETNRDLHRACTKLFLLRYDCSFYAKMSLIHPGNRLLTVTRSEIAELRRGREPPPIRQWGIFTLLALAPAGILWGDEDPQSLLLNQVEPHWAFWKRILQKKSVNRWLNTLRTVTFHDLIQCRKRANGVIHFNSPYLAKKPRALELNHDNIAAQIQMLRLRCYLFPAYAYAHSLAAMRGGLNPS